MNTYSPNLTNTGRKDFKIKRKIIIEPDMFYSEALKGLSATALMTLMRCLQKRTWKYKDKRKTSIIYTDDGFIFPYVEATFLGIGTTQHWKNMKTLIEKGFIDIAYQGGWYQGDRQKDYSVYKLSDRWKLYGTKYFVRVEKPRVLSPEYYIRNNVEKKKLKATSLNRSGHLHESEVDRTDQDNDRLHDSEVGSKARKRPERLANAI